MVAGLMFVGNTSAFVHFNQPTGTTCCYASAAMLITNLTGERRTPRDIMREYPQYLTSNGADHRLMKAVSDDYQLGYEKYAGRRLSHGFRAARRIIPNGGIAILLVGPGAFTSTGHCMVLYKYRNGRFWVSNPKPGAPDKSYTEQNLRKQGDAVVLWLYD
jgi:hypothetical protein